MAGGSWPGSPSTRPSAPPAPFLMPDLHLPTRDSSAVDSRDLAGPSHSSHGSAEGIRPNHLTAGDAAAAAARHGYSAASAPAVTPHGASTESSNRRQPAVASLAEQLRREKAVLDGPRERRQPLGETNMTKRTDADVRGPRARPGASDVRDASGSAQDRAGQQTTPTMSQQNGGLGGQAVPSYVLMLRPRTGSGGGRQSGPVAGPLVRPSPTPSVASRTSPAGTSGRPLVPSPLEPGETPWWQEAYQIDWQPKRFVMKFRQQIEGFRLGANCELQRSENGRTPRGDVPSPRSSGPQVGGFDLTSAEWKMVLKPAHAQRTWKVMYEPSRQDVRFLTRKIRVGRWLNFQMGFGHDFRNQTTGFKWRISSPLGVPQPTASHLSIRHKTTFPIVPGVDVRAGWRAEYTLPDIHGSAGMGESFVGVNVGRLTAAVDRIETIFTHQW